MKYTYEIFKDGKRIASIDMDQPLRGKFIIFPYRKSQKVSDYMSRVPFGRAKFYVQEDRTKVVYLDARQVRDSVLTILLNAVTEAGVCGFRLKMRSGRGEK